VRDVRRTPSARGALLVEGRSVGGGGVITDVDAIAEELRGEHGAILDTRQVATVLRMTPDGVRGLL
jgi:hypothetical protein